jgi:hypothetical protein
VTQREFFEKLLQALDANDIPYMVTGSVGAMIFGRPRLTNDLDVVVELDPKQVDTLARQFDSEDFYFPPREAVREDIARRGQFNILHIRSGSKIDIILRKETAYAREAFARRTRVPFTAHLDAASATPEDIILSKLLFYREGGSEKHLADIQGILVVSGQVLDRAYLARWVDQLGLAAEWQSALTFAGSDRPRDPG